MDTVVCGACGASVPAQNLPLHALRCKPTASPVASPPSPAMGPPTQAGGDNAEKRPLPALQGGTPAPAAKRAAVEVIELSSDSDEDQEQAQAAGGAAAGGGVGGAAAAAAGGAAAGGGAVGLFASQHGCEPEEARFYLGAASGDAQVAAALFREHAGQPLVGASGGLGGAVAGAGASAAPPPAAALLPSHGPSGMPWPAEVLWEEGQHAPGQCGNCKLQPLPLLAPFQTSKKRRS